MIDSAYVQAMARYNRWQNESLYGAADRLAPEARTRERGAFFGSIQKTLSHILWADRVWLSRFTGGDRPETGIDGSVSLYPDWKTMKEERARWDAAILSWAEALDPAWLAGTLRWFSGATQREIIKPKWILVAHMFNHQTHHRGQVHCMITQAGDRPGDTDLPFMPE